jgi:hypothetical protein
VLHLQVGMVACNDYILLECSITCLIQCCMSHAFMLHYCCDFQ